MIDPRTAVLTGGCQCGAVRYALYARPEGARAASPGKERTRRCAPGRRRRVRRTAAARRRRGCRRPRDAGHAREFETIALATMAAAVEIGEGVLEEGADEPRLQTAGVRPLRLGANREGIGPTLSSRRCSTACGEGRRERRPGPARRERRLAVVRCMI
jgi:hypothetical protein